MVNYINTEQLNPTVFLHQVHQALYARINKNVAKDIRDAYKLQKFFQGLKTAAMNATGGFRNYAYDQIFQTISTSSRGFRSTSKLFQRKDGISFEKEIADVIEAIGTLVVENYKKKVKRENITTGKDTGTVSAFVTDAVEKISKDMDREIKNKVAVETSGELQQYVLPYVSGKIDVQGGNISTIDIKLNGTPYLQSMFLLLNQATFSAKNYQSVGDEGQDLNKLHPTLKLGNSQPYRAYAGALSSLGYDSKIIETSYIRAYQEYERHKIIGTHIYHLRYYYELTGAGIISQSGKILPAVKFLIYNNPTGADIWVKSTGEIIQRILENNSILPGVQPFGKSIQIKKGAFKIKT